MEVEFEKHITSAEQIRKVLLSEEIHGVEVKQEDGAIKEIRLEGVGFDYYIIQVWAGMIMFYHGRYVDP